MAMPGGLFKRQAKSERDQQATAAVEQMMDSGDYTRATRFALQSQAQNPRGEFWRGRQQPQKIRQVGTDGTVREFDQTPMQQARWRQADQVAQQLTQPEYPAAPPGREGWSTGLDGTPYATPPGARSLADPTERQVFRRQRRPAPTAAELAASHNDGLFNPGTVNGKEMMVPTAGNYGRAREELSRLGLSGDPSPQMFRQRLDRLADAGVEHEEMDYDQRLRAQTKRAEAQAAGEWDLFKRKSELTGDTFTQKQQLAQIRGAGAGNTAKTPLEVQRDYIKRYNDDLGQWNKDQSDANRLQSAISAAKRKAKGNVDAAVVKFGKEEMSVQEAQAVLNDLRRPRPTREDWADRYGIDPAYLDPRSLRDGGASPAPTSTQPAPATQPAQPQNQKQAILAKLTPESRAALKKASPEQQKQFWSMYGL